MRRWLAALVARGPLSAAFSCFSILIWSQATFAERQSVPLFLSTSNTQQQGFVRVVNRSDQSGTATIHSFDDSGRQTAEVVFVLEAKATKHFNSQDLETGNADKGLSHGIGDGQGDWRLEIESDLDIEALTYMRTADGFLTSLHDLVPEADGHHRVVIFNPGSNRAQESRLRLINPGWEDAEITITGLDDAGRAAADQVRVLVSAWDAHTITASQLESGHGSFTGRLGDGDGKWQLSISASVPIRAMSLLGSPTGHLTNLSTAAPEGLARRNEATSSTTHAVPLFMSASNPLQQGFVRVVNRSRESGEVAIHAIDDSGQRVEPVSFVLDAGVTRHFNSDDLEMGNPDKGLARGVGGGQGDWRLEVESALDIEVLAYMRTADGFLTSLHDLVPEADGHHRVAMFNPGSNRAQASRLRLINPGTEDAEVAIRGMDDKGWAAPVGDACIRVPAGEARTITASQLEAGHRNFAGRLGDGAGKWQLLLSASAPIQAMSLLESPTGHLTNLSTSTAGGLGAFTAMGLEGVNCEADGAAASVEIPDANLRAAVETALGKAPGETISVAEMAWLSELDAWRSNIVDLTGLEHAARLKSLKLRGNDIVDLSPLSGLAGLTYLSLGSNAFVDLSPLSGLTKLEELYLENSNISDLSPLSDLVSLKTLDLRGNDISDLSPLSGLANLRWLILNRNDIVDVSPLEGLVPLVESRDFTGGSGEGDLSPLTISLSDNPLSEASVDRILDMIGDGASVRFGAAYTIPVLETTDQTPVSIPDVKLRDEILRTLRHNDERSGPLTIGEIAQLVTLHIPAGVVDLTGLEHASNLVRIVFRTREVEDLSVLSDLPNLKSVGIYSNLLGRLPSLPNLRRLSAYGSSDVDLSRLSGLTGLRGLSLDRTGISDLPSLSGLTNLRWLNLSGNKISDLSPLSGLSSLQGLKLRDNEVSDLSPLSGLTSLTFLDLRANDISDLSPLSGLIGLTFLDLRANDISDLSGLPGFIGPTFLDLRGNNISDLSPLSGLTGLTSLNLYADNDDISDLSPLSSLTSLRNLVLGSNLAVFLDLSPLSNLNSLEELRCHRCNISEDHLPLSGLASLKEFVCQYCSVSDLSLFSGLTSLTHLYVIINYYDYHNRRRAKLDLADLSGLTNLERLGLGPGTVFNSNPSSLQGLTELAGVYLEGSRLEGGLLRTLSRLPNLRELKCPGCRNSDGRPISDLSPLSSLTSLESLHLGVPLEDPDDISYLSDLSPLSGLTNLRELKCPGCNVSDLTLLSGSGLPRLEFLDLSDNNVWDLTPLLTRTGSPVRIILQGNPHISADDYRIAEEIGAGWSIWLPPIDRPVELSGRLRAAVEKALGKASGEKISVEEMATLVRLEVPRRGASDEGLLLAGIELAEELTHFTARAQRLENGEAWHLGRLRHLTHLDLGGNPITDISWVADLANLTYLDLRWGGGPPRKTIEYSLDISPLSGLRSLTHLDLGEQFIVDMSPLSSLTSLTYLNLLSPDWYSESVWGESESCGRFLTRDVGPAVRRAIASRLDLSPLSGLIGLTDLHLDNAIITDLSPLSGLASLTNLSLGSTDFWFLDGASLTDLSPLSGLIGLTTLSIGRRGLTDLSGLSGLTGLTRLSIDGGNRVVDLSPLSGLIGLTHLDIGFAITADLSPLSGLAGLTYLRLSGNDVTDLSPLSGLIGLTDLDLTNNIITDLSPLSGLAALTYLRLGGNSIADPSPLSGLTGLMRLDLSRNVLANLPPLSGLAGLRALSLRGNGISDITPLLAENAIASDLGFIDLTYNPLSEASRNNAIPTLRGRGITINFTALNDANAEFPYSLLTQIHNDNVVVMGVNDPDVTDYVNIKAWPIYSREFYKIFEDVFDYLFILVPEYGGLRTGGGNALGLYFPVSNNVRGIGRSIFYNRSYGSGGKLKGVIWLSGASFDGTSGGGGTALHELIHTWANHAITDHVPFFSPSGHWGTSSANGLLGGFDRTTLQNLGGGRYSAREFGPYSNSRRSMPYSPIELYFAGYLPPDEVPNLWVGYSSGNVRSSNGRSEFEVEKVAELSIDDIIARVGERLPDSSAAQRHHRAAVIVLSRDPARVPADRLQRVSESISTFSLKDVDDDPNYYNFFEATGGRGSITMDSLSQYRKPTASAPILPASYGTPPPSPSYGCYCPSNRNGIGGFTHDHSVGHAGHLLEIPPRDASAPLPHGGAGSEAKDGDGWLGKPQSRIRARAASAISEPEPSRRP